MEFPNFREFRGLNDLSYPTDKPSELDSSEEFVDASDLVDPGVSESLLTEISTNPAVSSAAVETVLASDNSQILPNCSPSVEEKSKSDTFADATDINCNRVLSSDLQAKSNGNHSPTPDLSDIQNQTVAQELLVSILAEIDSREQLVSEPEEQQKLLESPPTTTCEHSKIQSTPGCEKDFSPEANNTKVEPKMNETVVTGGGDTPIAAKGEYKIDWDNLEQYDPFGGKSPGAKVTPKVYPLV